VDAAALLGAGAVHQRGLRQARRHPDDAGREGRGPHPQADLDLLSILYLSLLFATLLVEHLMRLPGLELLS
jgi:hypothetical protein